MFFVRGILRFQLLFLAILVPYILCGGHFHVLFQPFVILFVILIFGACHLIYNEFDGIANEAVSAEDVKRSARSGLILSTTVPFYLGLIHTMGYLDSGLNVIVEHVVAASTCFLYGPLFYYSFFFPYFKNSRKEAKFGFPNLYPKIWKITVGMLASIGFIVVTVLPIGLSIDALWPTYTDAHHEAWRATDRRMAAEEETFAKNNCSLMPEQLARDRRNFIELEEYKKRGLRRGY